MLITHASIIPTHNSSNTRASCSTKDGTQHKDGTNNTSSANKVVGSLEFPAAANGTCIPGVSGCDVTEFCDTSEDYGRTLRCDPETGFDSSRALGHCTSLCEQTSVVEYKDQLNSLFEGSICNSTSDTNECGTGFVCKEALPSCHTNFQCQVLLGDDGSAFAQVTGDMCAGMCFKTAKEMVNATFNNEGTEIEVMLSTKAQEMDVPCSMVFDQATGEMLGGASCSVKPETRDLLYITMGGDATIKPGAILTLAAGYSHPLRDFLEPSQRYNAEVTVTVESCSPVCAAPTASLVGPSTVRAPCTDDEEYQLLFLDGSASGGESSRELKSVTWGTDTTEDCASPSGNLTELIGQANTAQVSFLKMSPSVLGSLEEGSKYCITLQVTNFLGVQSESVTHQIIKQSNDDGTPVVALELPVSTTIASGLVLSGSVLPSSVCEGEVAEFKWECISEGCSLLAGDGFQNAVARELSPSDLILGRVTAGTILEWRLTARVRNSTVTTSVTGMVRMDGDEMIARFSDDSSSGFVARSADFPLMLDASPSEDPSDPNNVVQAMRYSFSCTRPDGISACFKNDGQFYTGEIEDDMKWILDPTQFVEVEEGGDNTFILSVTIRKGIGANQREASTRNMVQVVAPTVPFVSARLALDCGDGGCLAQTLSSDDLAFSVVINNADEFDEAETTSYSWTVNQQPVLMRHLLTGGDQNSPDADVDSASITLRAHTGMDSSILPGSGSIIVSCDITKSGGASGVATSALDLVRPPVCGRPEGEGGCLFLPVDEQAFPSVAFRAEARGFSSPNTLAFEFGFVASEGGEEVLQVRQQAAVASATQLTANQGVGEYKVYAVAVDRKTGGRSTLAFAVFNLTEPQLNGTTCEEQEEEYNAMSEAAASNINPQRRLNSGDISNIAKGVELSNAFQNSEFVCTLNETSTTGTETGTRRRRALLAATATAEVQLSSLQALRTAMEGEVSVDGALDALNAISDAVAPGATTPRMEMAKLLSEITHIASTVLDDAMADDIGTNTIKPALRNMGLSAEALAMMCWNMDCSSGYSSPALAKSLLDVLWDARSLMRRNSPSGLTSTAVSLPASQAVSRNTAQATSTANVGVDVHVKDRSSKLLAGAQLASSSAEPFLQWCLSDPVCGSRDRLALYISYVRESSIYTNATSDFPDIIPDHFADAPAKPEAVSGILEVQFNFKEPNGFVCSAATDCTMNLRIPLNGGVDVSGKALTCVRLLPSVDEEEANTIEFRSSLLDSSSPIEAVDSDGNLAYVTCPVTRLGHYIIMSYTQPPPLPPPSPNPPGRQPPFPSPSPLPPPSPPPSPPSSPVQDIAPSTETPSTSPALLILPELLTPEEVAERFGITCSKQPNKQLSVSLTLNVDRADISANDVDQLEKRLQKNMDAFLADTGGLKCPVQVSLEGPRRSLLQVKMTVEGDMGAESSAVDVKSARAKLGEAADRGTLGKTIIDGEDGKFALESGLAVTVSTATVKQDFPGCSSLPGRRITAEILVRKDATTVSATEAAQIKIGLERAFQTRLDPLLPVQLDCPVILSLVSSTSPSTNRELRQDKKTGDLIVDLGNDTPSDQVTKARSLMSKSDALSSATITIDGVEYSIEARWEDYTGSSSDNGRILPSLVLWLYSYMLFSFLLLF